MMIAIRCCSIYFKLGAKIYDLFSMTFFDRDDDNYVNLMLMNMYALD